MRMQQLLETLETHKKDLEVALDRVHWSAGELVLEYQDFHFKENKTRANWEDKSSITLKVRRRASSIGIWWAKLKWSGPAGKRQSFTKEFPKQRGKHTYDLTQVIKEAQDWEVGKIQDVERRAAQLRLQAVVLSEQLMKVNEGLKKLGKHFGQDDESDGD